MHTLEIRIGTKMIAKYITNDLTGLSAGADIYTLARNILMLYADKYTYCDCITDGKWDFRVMKCDINL